MEGFESLKRYIEEKCTKDVVSVDESEFYFDKNGRVWILTITAQEVDYKDETS